MVEERNMNGKKKEPMELCLKILDADQKTRAVGRSLVYVTGNVTYLLPFGEKRINLSPKAFYGNKHLLCVQAAKRFEVDTYRNLAVNVCDQHHLKNCYPHASANVETRGESVFAAQNAIDGVTVNCCHGTGGRK
ncbi:MAG: hypothetical protein HFH16_08740 [Ruminococcus sp.]|uniref:Uncharacterized protein n=1 Tax=Schaedlerella arabinosiphila TaxID=2044587 RepID=A0A426DE16_9FIRM|nr:hypothetical protein [Ruminococcus sp.]RRK30962.1 hypothetical protein EBB54_05940 [Schaedlerella arabinosiphila]